MYVASKGVVNYMLRKFIKPTDLPYFEAGVTTHLLFDDGSKDWKDLDARAGVKPVLSKN